MNIDGVAKSSTYFVVAGTTTALRTICTSPLGRHHHASYIKRLCLAIQWLLSTFYGFIIIELKKIVLCISFIAI